MQRTIHDEISNKLKSIDRLRAKAPNKDENTCSKITEYKNKIAEMLKILSHLKELLQTIQQISIDSFVDLLTHKFNVIETESSVNELLHSETLKSSSLSFTSDILEPTKDDFSAVYLNDILRRCSELKHELITEDSNENVVNDDVVRDMLWPEVMNRLDHYLDNRMKIKVDLKHITSEEEVMVDSIRTECVESIMDGLFRNN